MKKFKKSIIISIIAIVAVLSLWIWHHNVTIVTTQYTVSSEKLPSNFDGFTIVQVSDLHNDLFGKENCKLIDAIKSAEPDIIALTGDIMDSYEAIKSGRKPLIDHRLCSV